MPPSVSIDVNPMSIAVSMDMDVVSIDMDVMSVATGPVFIDTDPMSKRHVDRHAFSCLLDVIPISIADVKI